jgi:integrase
MDEGGGTDMSWTTTLDEVLKQHNKAAARGGKGVGFATQAARQETLWRGFKELRALKFLLEDVRQFKERHLKALGYAWEAKGLSASTIQNRISVFRTFAEWIGKPGMILGSEHYVKNPHSVERHSVAQCDKTWSGQQQQLSDKLTNLQAQDIVVAMQLELQRAFGLRMREAALLKVHQADKGTYLAVNWGTKGGRDRIIPIQTDYQRDVLVRAKSLIKHKAHSLIPGHYNFKQWKNHYYYVCHANGISRKDGITSHGLRHERLNEIYQAIAGQASPIKATHSPKGNSENKTINSHVDQIARQEIAEIAGHSRLSVTSAYIGGSW